MYGIGQIYHVANEKTTATRAATQVARADPMSIFTKGIRVQVGGITTPVHVYIYTGRWMSRAP